MKFDFIEKIKGLKNSKLYIYIGIFSLALLFLFFLPDSKKESKAPDIPDLPDTDSYIEKLERKTEKIIERIDGVKSCRVAITPSGGYSKLYATDGKFSHQYSPEGELISSTEEREHIFAGESQNRRPVIIRETLPKIEGAAVVCSGIDSYTEDKIIKLLCALFDIKSNKICVITQ